MKVRRGFIEDVDDMAEVQLNSWKVDSDIADINQVRDILRKSLRDYFRNSDEGDFFLVAENDQGEVVGFVSGGARISSVFPDYDGELYHLYVLKHCQRRGIGRLLVQATIDEFFNNGITSLQVWVCLNSAGPGFLEKMGAAWLGERTTAQDDLQLTEVAYGISFSLF